VADILEDCRLIIRNVEGWSRVGGWPDPGQPVVVVNNLTKVVAECERLRKDLKIVRARRDWLILINVILFSMLTALVLGGFWHAFLCA